MGEGDNGDGGDGGESCEHHCTTAPLHLTDHGTVQGLRYHVYAGQIPSRIFIMQRVTARYHNGYNKVFYSSRSIEVI